MTTAAEARAALSNQGPICGACAAKPPVVAAVFVLGRAQYACRKCGQLWLADAMGPWRVIRRSQVTWAGHSYQAQAQDPPGYGEGVE